MYKYTTSSITQLVITGGARRWLPLAEAFVPHLQVKIQPTFIQHFFCHFSLIHFCWKAMMAVSANVFMLCLMPIHIWPESNDFLGIISTDFSFSPTPDWDQPNFYIFNHPPLASFDILAAHFVCKPIAFKALDRHWWRCWWQEVSSKGTEAL